MLGAGCEPASAGEAAPGRARFDVVGAGPVAWRLDEEFAAPGIAIPSSSLAAVSLGTNELLLGTQGAALLYTRGSNGWSLTERWTTSDPFESASSGAFGGGVALSGDTALVGCSSCTPHGTDSGAVYVYVRSGGSWSLQQVLTIDDEQAGDLLGTAVALDGDTALVASAKGAHVFTRTSGSFSELTTLATPSPASDVALKGELAVVIYNSVRFSRPEPRDEPPFRTGAFLVTRTTGTWTAPVDLHTDTAAHAAVAFDHAFLTSWESGGFPWQVHDGSWLEFSAAGTALQEQPSGSLLAASSLGVLVSTSSLERKGSGDREPTNRSAAMLWPPNGEVYDFASFASPVGATAPDLLAMSDDFVVFANFDGSVRVLVRYAETELECAHDRDCLSQHCVDGICCDSACTDDPCQSCKASEKGYGPDGVCDWIGAETQTSCGEPSCRYYMPPNDQNEWAVTTPQCRDRQGCVDIPEYCGRPNSCQNAACVTPGAGTGGTAGTDGTAEVAGEAPSAGSAGDEPAAGGDDSGLARGGTAPATRTPVAGLPRQHEKSEGGCNLPQRPPTGGAELLLLLAAARLRRRGERSPAARIS